MKQEKSAAVHVPKALHLQSRFFAATAKLWHQLGKLESSVLSDDIEQIKIQKPDNALKHQCNRDELIPRNQRLTLVVHHMVVAERLIY